VLMLLVAGAARLLVAQRAAMVAAQAEASAARDAAEQATRAKSAFLATMSHEIRTPMNGVLGMAELIERTPLDAHQRRLAHALTRSGRALLALINDLLDYSKVEAGRLSIESEPFDLLAALDECVQLAAPAASRKGVRLEHAVAPGVPEWVLGDRLRLQQIVNNLLGNAVKFTDAGSVRLGVRAASVAGGVVVVEVADTGCGIDAAALPRLFEPFTQADPGTARRHGGTGLGLAIVQRLARAMGGEVVAASEPGRGSRFAVTLPLPAASRPEIQMASLAGTMGGQVLEVLVVEDNEVNQLLAQTQLEQLGHRVTLAVDGSQALELTERSRFDVVLMDCHMPGIDGYEATRRLREREAEQTRQRVYVVAVTASAMTEDRQRCEQAGMDAFLGKPYTRAQLVKVLEAV
jgi:two-component system, sensor histidine kinase